jgi:glutathione S-transferase
MPKLFYSQSSCSAASFIACSTIGLNIDCEQVNIQTHKTSSDQDFYHINPKGNVPCLILDDGTILNENIAVLNWIADQVGLINTNKIAPLNGTQDRYLVQNCLSYIASELHASIGGLFAPHSEEITTFIRNKSSMKLTYCENILLGGGREFLVGEKPTIADFYLFVVLSWCPGLNLPLTSYPRCQSFVDRMSHLENVKEAQSKMIGNPSSIMGPSPSLGEKISSSVQPAVDKVTGAFHTTTEFTKEKFSDLKEKFSSNSSTSTGTMTTGQPTTLGSSTTTITPSMAPEDNRPLNERIESRLASAQASAQPTVNKLSEKLQPTVNKVESTIHTTAAATNSKIAELQAKFFGPSKISSEQSKPFMEDAENKRPIN